MGFQKNKFLKLLGVLPLLFLFLSSCHPRIPDDALRLTPESLKLRQLQTRVFQTGDEAKVLAACTALLQDIGFNIDESESELGVIVASKGRSAEDAGEIITKLFISAIFMKPLEWSKNQKFRAAVVTMPIGNEKKSIAVRVTFQRIVWNTEGRVTTRESLEDPGIYEEFFDKLSKSLFLEAQEAL